MSVPDEGLNDTEKIARHWSGVTSRATGKPSRWWESWAVIRHQNRIICGEPIDGFAAGLRKRIAEISHGAEYRKAISIGCGTAAKELALIEAGIVHSFDLYELSPTRIEAGRRRFAAARKADRGNFILGDAFAAPLNISYDLVYWDNSLHHMLDTVSAIRWSKKVLRKGGLLVVNDYVGPNRFQWSAKGLAAATRVRSILPEKLVRHVNDSSRLLRQCGRPNPELLASVDPSEAADSERIIPALLSEFPGGSLWWLGGYIYHTGLSDLIGNFDEHNAHSEVALCLMIDEQLANEGENQYAAYLAKAT